MTEPIDDVAELTGKAVHDQVGNKIGTIKHIYAVGEDNAPAWVTVEISQGLGGKGISFVPIARVKYEDGDVTVPYTSEHIEEAPKVDASDELGAEDERKLRDYYAIDLADGETRTDNDSYSARMPADDGGSPRRHDGDGDLAATSEAVSKTEDEIELKQETRKVTFDQ